MSPKSLIRLRRDEALIAMALENEGSDKRKELREEAIALDKQLVSHHDITVRVGEQLVKLAGIGATLLMCTRATKFEEEDILTSRTTPLWLKRLF